MLTEHARVHLMHSLDRLPMTVPPPLLIDRRPSWGRRFGDLSAVIILAGGLIGMAVYLRHRPTPKMPHAAMPTRLEKRATDPAVPPLHWIALPREGREMTRTTCPGDEAAALIRLDELCREALLRPQEWVLSLSPSPEEMELLAQIEEAAPLFTGTEADQVTPHLYSLDSPRGRVGIITRQPPADKGPGHTTTGIRVICWGFVLPQAEGEHAVWLIRPRERLPRSSGQGPP